MAPTGTSAKSLQNRPRAAVPKPVIPVIPLPYLRKQTNKPVARGKPKENIPSPPPVVETPTPSTSAPTTGPNTANGSPEIQNAEVAVQPESPDVVAEAAPVVPVVETETGEKENVESDFSSQDERKGKNNIIFFLPYFILINLIADDTPEGTAPSQVEISSETSPALKSAYQMPPAFYPATHNQPPVSDAVQFPPPTLFNGFSPVHHTHPSTGSAVMFGEYQGSNNSSPAPPPSTGNAPPHIFPQALHGGGRGGPLTTNGGHQQHMSNGYSPVAPHFPPGHYPPPPRQENLQGPSADGYGRRQMMSFAPSDGYSPSTTPQVAESQQRFHSYAPSTPHSFHGSQSSAPNDQDGPFYSQYPTAVISNGSNGHIDDVRLYQQRPKPRTGSQSIITHPIYQPQAMNQPPLPPLDIYDGLTAYIQSQFADPEFADYTLELRYTEDHAEPVRLPGHGIMFARSTALKVLIDKARESSSENLMDRTLLIESNDRFLRSDAFWMAVQRLYGLPLLDLGTLPSAESPQSAQSSSRMPGTPASRFDLALGYAAAGKILQILPVLARGIEIASHFISWATLEKALDFALDGGLDASWTLGGPSNSESPSTYGPLVNVILNAALGFIITNFPPNFEFDATVSEPSHNRRLPSVTEDQPSGRNARLSAIKFGDHDTEDIAPPTPTNPTNATLSKILLNLPYHLLKYVLESPRLGNVSGWATSAIRQKTMHSVIKEREKRRIKVYASRSSSNEDRLQHASEWNAVGWEESIAPYDQSDENSTLIPALTRKWVDIVLP